MDLSKMGKEDLENILYDILEDLENSDGHLAEKYEDMIEDILYCINEPEAVDIVHSFKPNGEAFSLDRIREILVKMHVSEEECIDYYLCMNMFYNDFKMYAENRRLDIQEFCFEMSKLFIHDSDAPKHKVSKFFKMYLDDEE